MLLFLLLLLPSLVTSQYICPTSPININQGLTGSIPSNGSRFGALPVDYNCDYEFSIPNGYAIRFNFYATYDYDSENITYVDTVGVAYRLYSSTNNRVEWAVHPNAHLIVQSITGTSKVLVLYEYVDVSKFTRVRSPTGNVMSLSFQDKTYYSFYSKINDSIVVQLSKPYNNLRSPASNYFIFDGPDITTSRMIGRLSDYPTTPFNSTGSSISFVNFYGPGYSDFLIANDKSALGLYKSYTFTLLANNPTYPQTVTSSPFGYSANTFYCVDCETLYLESLLFSAQGSIQLVPQSPTSLNSALLTYESSDFNNATQLPQVIATKFFTIIYNGKYSETHVGVKSDNWLVPSNGRQGYLFSPNTWKAGTQSVFSYDFSSTTDFKYSLSFLEHNLDASSTCHVAIGNDFAKTYDSSSVDFSDIDAVGTFMNVTYNGDYLSNMTIKYQMTSLN